MVTSIKYYDLSIDAIKDKVIRQRKKNGKLHYPKLLQLDNVKIITNEFGEKITRIDGDIPVDLDIIDHERYLFISFDQSSLTHGFHKYPAKFFPELPRWIINRYSKRGDLVLDPFSGSATANIEALLNHRNSYGIDIEPFARFLSNVKITPVNVEELEFTNKYLINKISAYHPDSIKVDEIPTFSYIDNWFNKEIILELAYIKKSIFDLDCSEKLRNFYLSAFSSIIRSVSNADDNCTRTVVRKSLNKQVFPSDALRKFVETIFVWTPKLIEFSNVVPKDYFAKFPDNMDARNIVFPENTFDLALTSPPYANAVDYPRTHQLESYWLDLAEGSLTPQKKLHVGTESVTINQYKDLHQMGISSVDKILESIYSIDKRRAYICYKYLEDMKSNIQEVNKVLKPGARYVVVVGNNRIRGHLFENWKYLMEIAQSNNFHVENYFGSEIIKHFIKVPREERINTDWIIVLRKG